jgi:hypothetical protein
LAETPPSGQEFNQAKKLVTSLPIIGLVGGGITVRKGIDTLIAISCIEKGLVWFEVRCSSLASRFAEFSATFPFTSSIPSDTLRGGATGSEQGGIWMT